jgi:4-hydroxybenzoate polyprenyltransferase
MKRARRTAWLELLRLPNVFTAVADVMMGYLVTHAGLEPRLHFGLLVAASCLLYLSGIVLNDVFDAGVDARGRPDRPIPSGRISLRAASAAGWTLLAAGVLVACLASLVANDVRPGLVAIFLAASIVLYDGPLKRTFIAPLVMGECRMLNVLLGMSVSIVPWDRFELLVALGIGVYIVGVTIFARTDARQTDRRRLAVGLAVLLAGIAFLAGVPALSANRPPLVVSHSGWYLLWAALAFITARRCLLAVFNPEPARVQAAVRHCVHSIIVLDAAVCVGYASPYWGFVVLVLLLPTLILTAWIRAT